MGIRRFHTDRNLATVRRIFNGIVDNIITQSNPGKGDSLFGVLQLSCTGTDCDKAPFNKPSYININTINSNGVNRDKVMNPREWWEK